MRLDGVDSGRLRLLVSPSIAGETVIEELGVDTLLRPGSRLVDPASSSAVAP
jgi:hypothetical protein